jgi:hypothetical protein
MDELLIAAALWLALDMALLLLWVTLANRHTRRQVRAMVGEAERHANAARPLAAALNSGHAEDPEVRHAHRRAQAVQAQPKPL